MAFLISAPAADLPQPKPRRTARLPHAGDTHSTTSAQLAEGCDVKAKALLNTPPPSALHNRLIPLTDWNQYHAWPPIGGLRHLVFFERTNGFDKVVRRVGRRVLIDEASFFAWVDSTNGGAA
ncbi:hypothetical protein [Simplicispira suum]|uniref:hypothetical protein n=1 Tax=Simplicispira suum TaxID=2109915 RepID=UPI0023552FD9|nr:hypothetical protein [Simplicispira suum]